MWLPVMPIWELGLNLTAENRKQVGEKEPVCGFLNEHAASTCDFLREIWKLGSKKEKAFFLFSLGTPCIVLKIKRKAHTSQPPGKEKNGKIQKEKKCPLLEKKYTVHRDKT